MGPWQKLIAMSASQWQDFKSGQQAKFDALPDKRKQVPERRIAAREGKKPPRWETLPAQARF
jgi:hypothetical protein